MCKSGPSSCIKRLIQWAGIGTLFVKNLCFCQNPGSDSVPTKRKSRRSDSSLLLVSAGLADNGEGVGINLNLDAIATVSSHQQALTTHSTRDQLLFLIGNVKQML